jgi:uncharacterized protein YjbI with pentapeptide repeats
MNKQDALTKIDELKKFVEDCEKKEIKKVKIQIKNRFTGTILFESEKETIKEAVLEAKDREANLYGADLSGADLRGANLSEADLSEADLRGADLRGANLSEADLSGADLRGANLYEADLSGADLYGAELNNAKFYGRGGHIKIKKENLAGFLGALGFDLES